MCHFKYIFIRTHCGAWSSKNTIRLVQFGFIEIKIEDINAATWYKECHRNVTSVFSQAIVVKDKDESSDRYHRGDCVII